ncbi:response regulator [Poseidonibacter sp.]|uniref:response regulator n=1 Tax=Poseidonibacter sp. TaxID=2321188 RepID=UPI00359E1C9A
MRVLIVDDSRIIRNGLKNIFLFLGHNVIGEAVTGFEAINMYKTLSPDLVTMDISMPMRQGIKDGVSALKEIIDLDPNAKVIMVTSHGEEHLVVDSIKLGAKGYILKPITEEKVINSIEKIFPDDWMN